MLLILKNENINRFHFGCAHFNQFIKLLLKQRTFGFCKLHPLFFGCFSQMICYFCNQLLIIVVLLLLCLNFCIYLFSFFNRKYTHLACDNMGKIRDAVVNDLILFSSSFFLVKFHLTLFLVSICMRICFFVFFFQFFSEFTFTIHLTYYLLFCSNKKTHIINPFKIGKHCVYVFVSDRHYVGIGQLFTNWLIL